MIAYARGCSWRASKSSAAEMARGAFRDWERGLVALKDGCTCGYCTVANADCIPAVPYTPCTGYVFVDESCCGRRCSQAMIDCAAAYLKRREFDRVYLVSDHENLYEKFGLSHRQSSSNCTVRCERKNLHAPVITSKSLFV